MSSDIDLEQYVSRASEFKVTYVYPILDDPNHPHSKVEYTTSLDKVKEYRALYGVECPKSILALRLAIDGDNYFILPREMIAHKEATSEKEELDHVLAGLSAREKELLKKHFKSK
jgi:hypothetical protein